jgi:exosortase family protein XrtF
MRQFFSNPFYAFLSKAFGLYFFWYLTYELWLHPKAVFDNLVIENLVFWSESLLRTFGYALIPPGSAGDQIRVVGIDGTHGLWIGDPCNGISLFALFTGFVIAFPGPVKAKLWYIPAGIVFLHFINVLRIVGLTMVLKYYPSSLAFNHTYTFTIVVYSFVFLLWILWVNKFSGVKFSLGSSAPDSAANQSS